MLPVRKVMRTPVVTASESETAFTAACRMVEHEIGCLVVCRDMKPVGVVTDTDLIKKVICEKSSSFDAELSGFMSSPVVSIGPLTPLDEAAELMESRGVKRLPVVDDVSGELVGIVGAKDLIAAETTMIHLLEGYLDSMREPRKGLK